MEKDRLQQWIDNSQCIRFIDILLIGNAQGLGLLDIELIKEFPQIKINLQSEEERLKKLRHITLSELWVIGAYEFIRLISKITSERKDPLDVNIISKIKEILTQFTEIRIPLAKFQKAGQEKLFSGLSSKCEFDENKGLGWKIIFSYKKKFETKIFYRKDLADSLLELLKFITKEINVR